MQPRWWQMDARMQSILRNIRRRREWTNMGQEEVAKRCAIEQATYSRIERFTPADYRKFFATRDLTILMGLVDTGCRVGEMLAARLPDLDVDARTLVFRVTKGKEPRTVPISDVWLAQLRKWLRLRPDESIADTLFVSHFGETLHTEHFIHKFHAYRQYAGVEFSLHGLRHYAITAYGKVDLLAAARLAGHKDLRVTQGYLHDTLEHVQDVHQRTSLLQQVIPRKKRVI